MINKSNDTKTTNFERNIQRSSLGHNGGINDLTIQHKYEKEINLIMEIKQVILERLFIKELL